MPSDTVWVAVVGGSVTVASLTVQGLLAPGAEKRAREHEKQLQAAERDWQRWQQNVDRRRDLYADLLRDADSLDSGLDHVAWIMTLPGESEWVERTKENLEKAESRLRRTVALVEVQTTDAELVELANDIRDHAEGGVSNVVLGDVDAVTEHHAKLHDVLPELRSAVGRDLRYQGGESPRT
jgi:DNA repair ATPase RecN